ncbi:MAG: GNAT family N-acetyltransferase [Hyphomicrobium sp.]
MPGEISLRAVTAENWHAVAALRVAPSQEDLVASNRYSLEESRTNPDAVPLAIYLGLEPVGFLMYETLADEGHPHVYSIYRLMIDAAHQGRGHGRMALKALLATLRADRALERITICYVPENASAARFYASLGFRDVGLDEDGEMVAEHHSP